MKLSKIIGIAAIVFCTNSFAASVLEEINCPPISKVTNVNFTDAHRLDFSNAKTAWLLTSNEYDYDGKTWSTAFRVALDETNKEQALVQGKEYFQKKISLANPYSHAQYEYTLCIYANVKEAYIVGAVTPAIHGPIQVPGLV